MNELKKIIWHYYSEREHLDSLAGIVDIIYSAITGENKIKEFAKLPDLLKQRILTPQFKTYKPKDYWDESESV